MNGCNQYNILNVKIMPYQKIYFSTFSAVSIFKHEVLQYLIVEIRDLNEVKKFLTLYVRRCKCKMDVQYKVQVDFNVNKLMRRKSQLLTLGQFGRAVKNDIFNFGSAIKVTVLDFPFHYFNLEEFKEMIIQQKPWRESSIYWKGLKQEHIDNFYKTKYTLRDLTHDVNVIKKVFNF
jgi:hypothetical protein